MAINVVVGIQLTNKKNWCAKVLHNGSINNARGQVTQLYFLDIGSILCPHSASFIAFKFSRYLNWEQHRLYPFDKSQDTLVIELNFESLFKGRYVNGLSYLHRLINNQNDNTQLFYSTFLYAVRSHQRRLFFIPSVNTVSTQYQSTFQNL